jgi:hypothetical protein
VNTSLTTHERVEKALDCVIGTRSYFAEEGSSRDTTTPMGDKPLVRERLPALAVELERLLREQDRPDLAEQVASLRIVAVCHCEVEVCGSFYTAWPMKRWFRRGKQVVVDDLVVDTIDGEIVFVEVLGRPEVRAALHPS